MLLAFLATERLTFGQSSYATVILLSQDRLLDTSASGTEMLRTVVLASIMRKRKWHFPNSLITILCLKFGQVGYNAANEFLDAFVNYRNEQQTGFTLTINWNDWAEVGMSVAAMDKNQDNLTLLEQEQFIHNAITPEQGIEALLLLIEHRQERCIVSTCDLSVMMRDSNKLDEEALLNQEAKIVHLQQGYERPKLETEYVLPSTDIERKLSFIWTQILGIKDIGIYDDFFELGGDSFKAITIISSIYKKIQVKLPLPTFFQKPTIYAISQFIIASDNIAFAAIPKAQIKYSYSLTSAQRRLFALNQMDKESKQYNSIITLKIEGSLDYSRINQCLNELVKRHESLRTCFRRIDEEIMQIIETDLSIKADFITVDENSELQNIIEEWIKPINLNQLPLLNVGVFQVQEQSHLFVINIHHIISDGISNSILIREFASLYNNYDINLLPLLPVQYKDFAEWRNENYGQTLLNSEAYWLESFSDKIPLLNLPLDYPRASFKKYEGNKITFRIDKKRTKALKEIAIESEVTLYMTLFSIWSILLAKLSDQDDIIIGVPTSGRNHSDIQDIVGMFVNTLPIICNLKNNQTFSSLLLAVKKTLTHALEHQDYLFEDLVDKINIPRDFGRNPLFDVMFAFQNSQFQNEINTIEINDLNISSFEFAHKYSRFDLTLDGEEIDNELIFQLEYSTELFTTETCGQFINYFNNIIDSIIEYPQLKLNNISLLTVKEQNNILTQFNQTQKLYPESKLIHSLFEEQVEETPDAIALTFQGKTISYHELNQRANRVAKRLQTIGVSKDNIVGVITSHSPSMLISILAILKAGGAYLPIDPGFPEKRIVYMLKDSCVQIIVSDRNLEFDTLCQVIDLKDQSLLQEDPNNLPICNTSHDLAYCIYTSGTTGKPKGITIEHRSIINFIYGIADLMQFKKQDRFLSLTTISFDIFGLENILPLVLGHHVIVASENEQHDYQALLNLINREKISILQVTPSRLKLILTDDILAQNLNNINYLLVGGETFPPTLLEQVKQYIGKARVFNMYGPTETTIWSTVKELTNTQHLNIGKPIQNTQILILNKDLQVQPFNVTGNLFIGGDGLAREYFNQPKLTAEKFINNPYNPTEKIYCTGDLAKLLPNGTIDFIGREDFQVKIRGFRIEIEEIEYCLTKYSDIDKAVVIVQKDKQVQSFLAAYILSRTSVKVVDIKDYLLKHLPEYLIPQYIIQIEQIPLSFNGKIDRNALPSFNLSSHSESSHIEPTSKSELILAGIWKKILQIDKIGINDRFFEVGGNSIQIMQIVYEIQKQFSVLYQFKDFVEQQTIRSIALYLDDKAKSEQIQQLPEIIPEQQNLHEPFSLTNVQLAYYLGRNSQFELGGISTHAYHELLTQLDIKRLNYCLNLMIKRHPMLRTVFLKNAQQQVLKSTPEYIVVIHDLRSETSQKREHILATERERMSHFVFDPSQWPLFEIVAFRFSDNDYLLCISFDLLIMDAFSLDILTNEISTLYANPDYIFEDLTLSFRDYVLGYQKLKNTSAYEVDKSYWLDKLENFPIAPEIPLKINPSHVKKPHFKRKSHILPTEHWTALKKISQASNLTPSAILCAAYVEVLSYWSNQTDLGINITLFNRLPLHQDVKKIVGDFTSLILLPVHKKTLATFWDTVQNIHATLMESLSHRYYDGIEFIREISRKKELGNKAVMPIVFTSALFENSQDLEQDTLNNSTSTELEQAIGSVTQTSQVYLDNQIGLINGKIVISWDYIEQLFEPEIIDTMFEQYIAIINNIIEGSEVKSLTVSAVDEALILEYNNTKTDFPIMTLHELFEKKAAETPSAIAIEALTENISYQKLNSSANQVAHSLQQNGFGSGDKVAVLAKREIGTFINILGILKAGAAYVPIEPEYPKDRIDYILENSKCKLILKPDYYLKQKLIEYPDKLLSVVGSDQLAYIIYTSGSTGRPKGVMINHNAACNTILDINRKFNVSNRDRILGISSLCFDLSIYDIFGAFSSGGTLVLVRDQKDSSHLLEVVNDQKITIWNSVPAIMDRMIQQITLDEKQLENFDLRLFLLSGDWIPVKLPVVIKRFFPSSEVISLGGATEASIWSIYYPIREVSPEWRSIPYGHPLANQAFYVLNLNKELCPVGVTGELYIRGSGVATGYMNDKVKTDLAFIKHPRLGDLYKTGDYGILHRTGVIEYLGRKDHQVKINGYRIELGEIEAQLILCDNIQNAIVINSDASLISYLVPDSLSVDQKAVISHCRAHLARRLPDYMIPHHFYIIDKFPLTGNSKIDVKALQKMHTTDVGIKEDYVSPRNKIEKKLLKIIYEIVEIENIGIFDNFFEMGINSVHIARINDIVKNEFNKEIPILTMYEYPNISTFSEYLGDRPELNVKEINQEKIQQLNRGKERIKQRSRRQKNKLKEN